MTDILPITKIPRRGLPKHALVCGDPKRARRIAALLERSRQVGGNREYDSYVGAWKDVELVVSSHGVGGPGAMCLFEELATAGVETFIRVGTCGALRDGIEDGEFIIATAAIRDDGVTHLLVPPEFPAFSDAGVIAALTDAARARGHEVHAGLVWTKAVFFSGAFEGICEMPVEQYAKVGAIAVEMELSALLVMATMRGLRAGGILTSDGNPLKSTGYDPHREVVDKGVAASIEVALDALHALAEAGL